MKNLTEPGLVGVAVDLMAKQADRAMEVTQLADEYRADFVSVPDHAYLPGELETWTMLATLAARTEHVALLSNVTDLQLRPPAMLAKTVASLHMLSGGRAVLGIGAGTEVVPHGHRSFGAPARTAGEAVSTLDEALGMLRQLLGPGNGGPQTFDGTYFQLPDIQFGPVPTTPVPIWVGAFRPRMLSLAGRHGDGWLPTNAYLDLADVPAMQRRIDAAAEQAGRNPWDVRRVFNVMGAISDTGPTENGRQLIGPPSFWANTLADYKERLGFDSFTFWPVAGDRPTQVRRFFDEVRPQLPDIFQPTSGLANRAQGTPCN